MPETCQRGMHPEASTWIRRGRAVATRIRYRRVMRVESEVRVEREERRYIGDICLAPACYIGEIAHLGTNAVAILIYLLRDVDMLYERIKQEISRHAIGHAGLHSATSIISDRAHPALLTDLSQACGLVDGGKALQRFWGAEEGIVHIDRQPGIDRRRQSEFSLM